MYTALSAKHLKTIPRKHAKENLCYGLIVHLGKRHNKSEAGIRTEADWTDHPPAIDKGQREKKVNRDEQDSAKELQWP